MQARVRKIAVELINQSALQVIQIGQIGDGFAKIRARFEPVQPARAGERKIVGLRRIRDKSE